MSANAAGQNVVRPCLRRGRQALLKRALWLLVAFLALYHVTALVQFVRGDRFHDFAHYYLYARNLLDGHGLFDLEAPKALAKQLGIRYAEAPPVYSPPFYVAMIPLSMLPYHFAAVVWLVLNEVLLFGALMWRGAGRLHRNPVRMATLGLIVLAFQPLYETLALGQVNLLLLAGITLMVRLWSSGSSWCGVILGLIVLVKPQFAALGLLWIRPTEWRHLGVAAGTVCVAVLGSVAVVGQEPWAFHLQHLRDFSCDRSLWARNISLRGILFRLKGGCEADGFGDPMAVFATAAGVAILGLVAWSLWNNPSRRLTAQYHATSLVLCGIFLASPYTLQHHLTVLLIAFAGLAFDPERPVAVVHRWGWLLAYVLIATAFSLNRFPFLHLGWPSILLVGKSLGVLLLGLVLVTKGGPPRNPAASLLPPLLAAVGGARVAHAVLKAIIVRELTAAFLSQIILAAGLLLAWAVMFRARFYEGNGMRTWGNWSGRPIPVIIFVIAAFWTVGAGADWLPLNTPYKRHLAAGMLQLVILTLAAGYGAARWLGGTVVRMPPRAAWLAVVAGVVVYAAGLSYLSLARHQALLTGIWDLGYYTQITWELAHLQVPRSSVWNNAIWGHATFILALAAPFLHLFPDPATLLVVQSIVLALGALPAFFLGRRVWDDPRAGIVAAAAYLLYPPLQFANLFDFHPDTFATPILLAAFAALFAGRIGWALAWAGLLVIVKEDMALVAIMFGLYVAVVHCRRSGLVLAAGAAVCFVLLVGVILPPWIHAPYFSLFNRWPNLGSSPWEIVTSPLLRPSAFFGTLFQPERLGYLILLVIPLAGFPLFAPEILAVGLPPLASNLLSNNELQYTIRGHYTATLTPILIAAAVVGGRRAHTWLQQRGRPSVSVLAGLAATSVAATFAFSPLPWSQDPSARKHFWNAPPRHELAAIASRIPAGASVSAANHLGGHLALRKTILLFPSGADTADFVLVDVSGLDYVGPSPNPDAFRPLLHRLVETRPLVAFVDGLALFGRGEPSADTVARLVNLRQTSAAGAELAGQVALVASAVTPTRVAPRSDLRAHYSWTLRAVGQAMPCVAEALVSGGGDPVWASTRPMFHALLPAAHWPAGMVADDQAVFVVTETVPPGRYAWVVSTWLDGGPGWCRVKPPGTAGLAVAEVHVLPW